MNSLAVPNAGMIAQEQRRHFNALGKTKVQQEFLKRFSSKIDINRINQNIHNELIVLIEDFEKSVDAILEGKRQYTKGLYNNSYQAQNAKLLNIYYDFLDIYSKVYLEAPKASTDPYLQKLNNLINTLTAEVQSNPTVLFDKSKIQKSTGGTTSFADSIAYLSKQIKGVSLLEHGTINFIDKALELIPDESLGIVSSGQILIGGKQASQDAILFDKNLKIKTKSGKEYTLQEYFDMHKHEIKQTISFSLEEWENVMQQVVGFQSKYHRGGYIKMGSISLNEILQLDYKQAQALRNLYILSNQHDIDSTDSLITHKFNVKAVHDDYNALFSFCLGKFMNKLMAKNYYMITKTGVTDSYTYYNNLFNKMQYFRPKGKVNINNLDHDYDIHIREI